MENSYVCKSEDKGKRLDVFLQEKNSDLTRSHIKKLIEDNMVFLNGKNVKSGEKLRYDDKITIIIPEPKEISITPENIDIEIVYEDEYLAVINKAQGLTVHPCSTCKSGTLVNALLYKLSNLSGINGELRPGIVHRIDKNTSGLLVVAKNDFAHVNLSKQISNKTCKREYIALLEGVVKQHSGTIDKNIGRDKKDRKKMSSLPLNEGRKAVTHFEVLETYKEYCLVKFVLETGRTHQIRVHSKYINHPVVGDNVYNNKKCKFNIVGQMLHAYRLTFIHPKTEKEISFIADIPTYFEEILKKLRNKGI